MVSINVSVDDILDEIKRSGQEKAKKPIDSMEHVDEIIREILEKRQNDELRREGRAISLKEKMEIEEEIKVKTKTLTVEFEKMRQNHDKRLEEPPKPTQPQPPVHKPAPAPHVGTLEEEYAKIQKHLSPTEELNILRVQKQQQVKFRNTGEIELSQEIKSRREEKYNHIKRAANNERLLSEMKHITDHFGNFKMDDKSVEDGYQKLAINPNSYRELKSNRSRVIDAFVLDPKKPPTDKDEGEPKDIAEQMLNETLNAPPPQPQPQAEPEQESEFSLSEEVMNQARAARKVNRQEVNEAPAEQTERLSADDEYDYNHKSQKGEILESLKKTMGKATVGTIVFAVLSVISLGLLFSRPSDANILMAASVPVSPRIYSFVMIGLLLVSIIAGFSIISNAFHSIAEKKADKDILYTVAIIISFLSTCFISINPEKLLTDGILFYVPILVILMFFNFLSKRITMKRMIESFEVISSDEELYAVSAASDQKATESLVAGVEIMNAAMVLRNVKTGFIRGFLSHSCAPDYSDSISGKMTAAVFPVTIVVFALAFLVSHDFYLAMSLAGAAPLCLIGILLPLMVSMPLNDAAGVAKHFAGVMPDYDTIDLFSETDAVLIEATDLFPENSVLLHGIKTFKGKRIDNAIIDAASVVCSAKSVLAPVFLSIIASQVKLLKPVDSIVYEDAMGISAWVNEKRVLIGNRSLMINHSIAVPKEEYEQKYADQGYELIYLSCEGELSAAFVIEFVQENHAIDMVDLLQKNEVAMVIRSVDSAITVELIERVFGITRDTFRILPSHMHRTYAEQHEELKSASDAIANKGGTFAMVVLAAICKKMFGVIKLGGIMHIVGSVGAVLLLVASLLLKMPALAGGLQLLLFMAFFSLVYWIYEKNIKL